MAELERGQYGIYAGQGYVALAGQAPVGVEPRLRMPQRVKLESIAALIALAMELVRLLDAVAVEQQHLHDFDAVVLRGEHDGRDVGGELRVVVGRLPERVGGAVEELFVVEQLVLRVRQYWLGYLRVAHVNRQQQCFAKLLAVRLWQQHLHNLQKHF